MTQPKIRVLCLEDDEDTCELVTIILGAEGYEVITASTIATALELIQEKEFSLLIVDDHLPDGTGIDFIREVREANLLTPIIVHSGEADEEKIDRAMEAGANGYVVKPNGWPKLVETVNTLLHKNHTTN